MAEESQSILYIGYSVLFFLGVMMILGLFIPGLTNVETNIDVTQQREYRKAIVLENLLSLDADTDELYGYEYTHRRGVIPVEYFSNKDPGPDELGYKVNESTTWRDPGRSASTTTRKHCYIESVAGLDGGHFAFAIKPLVEEDKSSRGNDLGEPNDDYKSVVYNGTAASENRPCYYEELLPNERSSSVVSDAMLVRKDKNHSMLPVRLYVYIPAVSGAEEFEDDPRRHNY
ncbi:MAG: hypothetical protein ABEJ83_00455 [Candidatus Nanohaloarchaea archaeon]